MLNDGVNGLSNFEAVQHSLLKYRCKLQYPKDETRQYDRTCLVACLASGS